MLEQHLITVIIPVYKVEEYLEKCVQAVCRQTYKNLEILLVDDGSPDRCPEMCDAFALQDDRIRVIHKKTVVYPVPEMLRWMWHEENILHLWTAMIQ